MRAQAVTKVRIAASPREVFKYLGHLKYHRFWNPHMVRVTPEVKLRKGLVYHTESLLFGTKIQAANEVVELIDSKVLELSNSTGSLVYYIWYMLRKQDSGTLVTCRIEVSTDSPALTFAKPALGVLARRELQADLQLLKTVVEQDISV